MFTYFQSAVGGFLLHVATSTFLYGNGKVFGCSSMLYNSFANPSVFNVPVITGMAASFFAISTLAPLTSFSSGLINYLPNYANVQQVAPVFGNYTATMLVSGLLAGIGTFLGSGCTSGHMLCGLSRLSPRSLAATCVFSIVAMCTQALFHSAPACAGGTCATISSPSSSEVTLLLSLAALVYTTSVLIKQNLSRSKTSQAIVSFFSGSVFALGLMISGMASPGNTLGFLAMFSSKFNPSLVMVVFFGILPNLLEILSKKLETSSKCPTAAPKFDLPTKTVIDTRLVLGASIFGVAWGLSGVCPGPGVLASVSNGTNGLVWLASFLAGYHGVKTMGI